jgi:hypothetical protein
MDSANNAAATPPPVIVGDPRRGAGGRAREYERATNDMRLWETVPNFVGTFKEAPFRTNRWGMHDKDYSLVPPANTIRIALLGSSMTVGAGVSVEQSMETLLEDRLNGEGPSAPQRHYEILNFSVGGYGILQNVEVLDQKALSFKPNGLLIGIFSVEGPRMSDYLVKLVKARVPIEYSYIQQKLQQAGVTADMERPELLRRLAPLSDDLVRWSYRHMMEVCRAKGVAVVGVVLPEPRLKARHDIKKPVELARAVGLPLLDLRNMYEGQDVDSLRIGTVEGVGQNDPHWNARRHKLVADKVYEALRDNDAQALQLGFSARSADR